MTIGYWHNIKDETYWKDGLWAALEILKKKYDIRFFEDCEINIIESGSEGEYMDAFKSLSGKKIWLHAGGHPKNFGFEAVVVLADQIKREFEKIGVHPFVIGGTNTDLFKPMNLVKKWDVVFPAAFATWKRHWLLVQWIQERQHEKKWNVLAVGHKQSVEIECYKICEEAGFEVSDQVTPEELAVLYNESRECWIPTETIGGSEKTLWEARSCGLSVRVAPDNPRLVELLSQPVRSHYYYALQLDSLIQYVGHH